MSTTRRRTRVMLMPLVALLLASCAEQAPAPAVAATPVPDARTPVGVDTLQQVQVGGLSNTPLVVGIEQNDLGTTGTLVNAASPQPGPAAVPWFTPAGPVEAVTLDARVDGPLAVGFAAGAGHAQQVPMIWRNDPTLGWYPLVAGPPGDIATVQRLELGLMQPGWAYSDRWVGDRATALANLTGRPAPVVCPQTGGPSWVTFTPSQVDVLQACPSAGARDTLELQVRNNRAMTQQINIPPGATVTQLDDQPEFVGVLARDLTRRDGIVLLPPSKRFLLTIPRPDRDTQIALDPQPSALALALDLTVALGGLSPNLGPDVTGVAMAELPRCVDADRSGLQDDAPTGDDLNGFLIVLGGCLSTQSAKYDDAYGIAERFVARKAGIELITLRSDSTYQLAVENIAGRLNLLGQLARNADLTPLADPIRAGLAQQGRGPDIEPGGAAINVTLSGRLGP